MTRETSLKRSVSCEGIGVHSGKKVSLTLHAAPFGTGIVFLRGDLSSRPEDFISAHITSVIDTTFCTTLSNAKGSTARTVEHVLAALKGCGIHNAIVELSDEEVPIMDGSAAPFVEMIERSGVVTHHQAAPFLKIVKPVSINHGDSKAMLIPDEAFRLQMTFNAGRRLNNLSWTFDYSPDFQTFRESLASARTFGFYEDAEKMWAAGLAKGSSLENTVVFRDGIVMNEGLRFQDELVRHKLLDALGDLSLLGRGAIQGKFVGINSGHTLHAKLMKKIMDDPENYTIVTP